MVKEQSLYLMETSMSENSRMGENMVKEHSLGLVETSMLGNGRMGNLGTEKFTTKTETSQKSM